MPFQPIEGDILVSTRTWSDGTSPINTTYTECIYSRSSESNAAMVKVTTKKTYGPQRCMARLKWARFGEAAKRNFNVQTQVGSDVQFEYCDKIQDEDDWIPNGAYVESARLYGWSDQDIKKLIRTQRPDLEYAKIYRSKVETELASQKVQMATLKPTLPGPESASASASASASKLGLRERLLLKQQSRSEQPEQIKNPANSIAARMSQRGAIRDDTNCTLFIENVPDDYTEADIKTHIESYKFRRVNIVRREGQSVGKAFIELDSAEEALACMECINGQQWGYHIISAELSKPKPKKH